MCGQPYERDKKCNLVTFETKVIKKRHNVTPVCTGGIALIQTLSACFCLKGTFPSPSTVFLCICLLK